MQTFKRKITYFYQYHNKMVGTTAGYLKLEIRGDLVKIIINIQEPSGLPYEGADLYFYHETGDHLSAVKVDRVEAMNGVLTYQTRTEWKDFFDTGRDLYTFDGAVVVYNDTHYYVGDFKDISRMGQRFMWMNNRKQEEKKPDSLEKNVESEEKQEFFEKRVELENKPDFSGEKAESENKPIEGSLYRNGNKEKEENRNPLNENQDRFMDKEKDEPKKAGVQGEQLFEQCENCPYQEKRKEINEQEDMFSQMLETYPKLSLYGATELFQCVRIHPRDIGKLDMRNWKLGVNSFLTHGYYTYQYLLLGKMRLSNGEERNVIGVPGIYSNREKYLANMFGFEQFIAVQQTGSKTGEFGYWVVELR